VANDLTTRRLPGPRRGQSRDSNRPATSSWNIL